MANNLHRIISFPTPELRDILFWEEKDGTLAKHQTFVYGEPHPDAVRYPNHKLVYVASAPTDAAPNLQRWYYAANRVEQERHNWQVSYPYAGLKTCPRFTCTFIIPEEGYAPVDRGTAHPLDLGDDTPVADTAFRGAKLMFEREIEIPQELASLYKAIQRVYDKVPTIAEQLTHNVETSYPYAGLTTCPRYTRTLVISRGEFDGVAKGTADPVHAAAKLIHEEQVESKDEIIENLYVIARRVYDEVPTIAAQEAFNAEKEFPYHANTAYPRTVRRYVVPRASVGSATIPSADLGEGTLAFRKQDRFTGQMEDSLYVLVTIAHDDIPLLSNGTDAAFLATYGYRVLRPFGTDDHPRIEWRIPAVKSGYTPAVDYSACPITGYTGLLLVDEQVDVSKDNSGTLDLVRVFESLPGPELVNEVREKFADVPPGFIVERKIETLRQPVKNDATITALNTDATNIVGGALVRVSLGPSGTNKVIFEKGTIRETITLGTLTESEYDSDTGKVFTVTREIVEAGTAGSDINTTTGVFSTVQDLNQYFAIKTTRIASTLGTSTDAIVYDDVINWGWPAVLLTGGLHFFAVEAKNGHIVRYGYDVLIKEAYSGPCRATITETWSPTPQAVPTVVHLLPTACSFDFPMTRNFSIPRCLHPAITLSETVGTDHPELAYAVTNKTFAATNYTDWPSSIVAFANQTPFRGGFKMKVGVVYKPTA